MFAFIASAAAKASAAVESSIRDSRVRSPPAKNVFFAEVSTTPVIESFSATSRRTVSSQRVLERRVHDVGALRRVVHGQDDDAVRIALPG